jgi:hypothetical protein
MNKQQKEENGDKEISFLKHIYKTIRIFFILHTVNR